MAGSSLFTLIDDIASLLDDISVLTKVATRKTAGVLGDDLALNAQQVSGIKADRELPVVWAVAKGSLANKAILVPAALAIAALIPWAITPLLMIGGLYLCYEGVEKLAHRFLHRAEGDEQRRNERLHALADPNIDLVAMEKNKIKGAVRTDFILSAEIIVIAMGAVATASFSRQVGTLIAIALLITVFVYGLVAIIVKLDDAGLYLSQRGSDMAQALGRGILRAAPWLMKALSLAGTAAMFLVGGGILVHGISALHHAIEHMTPAGTFGSIAASLANAGIGFIAGAIALALVSLVQKMRATTAPATSNGAQ